MGRRNITLDDLSGWARAQVERKLGIERAGSQGTSQGLQAHAQQPANGKAVPIRTAGRQQNKTEAEYNRRYLNGKGVYEALSFHLPGGSRYTPDYMTVDETGRITLHEVKGSYRLHSHGRARTAFMECTAAFPMFGWVWAARQKDGTYKIDIIKSANDTEVL